MSRYRRARGYRQVAEINIANLVDVVLVLLIIFMISAPLLHSGIEIDLPKTRAAVMEEEAQGIVLTVDSKGGVYIDDIWARMDQFEDRLDREMRDKGTRTVFLRGDSAVVYGSIIDVIGRLKDMGIENIGLVTGHEESKRETSRRK